MTRTALALLLAALSLAACSFSSSSPAPPQHNTVVVPAQPSSTY